jgi:hypothetical protein
LDARRAAITTGTFLHSFQSGLPELHYHLKSLLGNANPAGVRVINENLRLAGVGVKGGGHATDVIAVAKRKEGKYADSRVFTGMETAVEVKPGIRYSIDRLLRQIKPQGLGSEGLRRQIEILFGDDLFRELFLSLETDYHDSDINVSEVNLHPLAVPFLE